MKFIRHFFGKYYFVFLFAILEFYAIRLILTQNSYQSARFFEFSTQLQGRVSEVSSYFSNRRFFERQNLQLQEENVQLRNLLASRVVDTLLPYQYEDSIPTFTYIPARVTSNSITKRKNYLIVNKGGKEGVIEGMAVLSPVGIVGVVDKVSTHYAMVMPVIHLDGKTSAKIKRGGFIGSVVWNGVNYIKASMIDVPSHFIIQIGDTVVTSGYSYSYPANIPIGVISDVKKDKSLDFHELELILFTDYAKLDHVYMVKNERKDELDELQKNQADE